MEAVAVAAIATSLFTFSSSSLLLVQNFVKSKETLHRLQQEIVVLQHILEECVNVVSSHTDVTTLPKSLVTALLLCHDRHIALLKTMERILSRKSRIERALQLSIRDQELMSSYRAFRESALLLRDLTSDLRMNRQLLEVSAEIAQLLLDEDESSGSDDEPYLDDKHDGTSIGSRGAAKWEPASTDHRDGDGPVGSTAGILASKKRRTKRRLEKFNRDVGELIASNWSRDLVVVFETDSEQPSKRFKFVPLRNKIDSYSDENFISHKIIDRYAKFIGNTGDTSVIRIIPEEQRKQRELTVLGGYKFVPEREIKLEWYRPRDPQKRETTFIIVDHDPPFDTLIRSEDWVTEAPKGAFPIWGVSKPKKQKKEEKKAEEEHERAELERIRKQLEDVSKLTGNADGKGKGKEAGGSSTTAPAPAPASTK